MLAEKTGTEKVRRQASKNEECHFYIPSLSIFISLHANLMTQKEFATYFYFGCSSFCGADQSVFTRAYGGILFVICFQGGLPPCSGVSYCPSRTSEIRTSGVLA